MVEQWPITMQRFSPIALILVLAGCVASPVAPLLTCPTYPVICQDYSLNKTLFDPIDPPEPSCPILGKFENQIDFEFCRCEHSQYARQLSDRAQCVAKRRSQAVIAIYNELVRVYNCRLTQDGCKVSPPIRHRISTVDYSNRQPNLPRCVASWTDSKFMDDYEAESCRTDVDKSKDELADWAEQEAEAVARDARHKADRAVERFNCYASGDDLLCF